jgi:hypothetical protein
MPEIKTINVKGKEVTVIRKINFNSVSFVKDPPDKNCRIRRNNIQKVASAR